MDRGHECSRGPGVKLGKWLASRPGGERGGLNDMLRHALEQSIYSTGEDKVAEIDQPCAGRAVASEQRPTQCLTSTQMCSLSKNGSLDLDLFESVHVTWQTAPRITNGLGLGAGPKAGRLRRWRTEELRRGVHAIFRLEVEGRCTRLQLHEAQGLRMLPNVYPISCAPDLGEGAT